MRLVLQDGDVVRMLLRRLGWVGRRVEDEREPYGRRTGQQSARSSKASGGSRSGQQALKGELVQAHRPAHGQMMREAAEFQPKLFELIRGRLMRLNYSRRTEQA